MHALSWFSFTFSFSPQTFWSIFNVYASTQKWVLNWTPFIYWCSFPTSGLPNQIPSEQHGQDIWAPESNLASTTTLKLHFSHLEVCRFDSGRQDKVYSSFLENIVIPINCHHLTPVLYHNSLIYYHHFIYLHIHSRYLLVYCWRLSDSNIPKIFSTFLSFLTDPNTTMLRIVSILPQISRPYQYPKTISF